MGEGPAHGQTATSLFELDGVVVERGDRRVFGPVALAVPSDGPIVISGPSGSGKSSLLRLFDRLDAPSAGTLRYRGRDVADLDPCAHRRRVAMVFQRPVLLPGTVADNLRAADPALDDHQVGAALERVGLAADLAERDARELSGGEAQRLCLARALTTDPEVVLFDEPTSSLDPDSTRRIEELALGLEAEGITTIWVTHDADQAARLGRHVITVADHTVELCS